MDNKLYEAFGLSSADEPTIRECLTSITPIQNEITNDVLSIEVIDYGDSPGIRYIMVTATVSSSAIDVWQHVRKTLIDVNWFIGVDNLNPKDELLATEKASING